MPLYEYECGKCHHKIEKIKKFNEQNKLEKCPKCKIKMNINISKNTFILGKGAWCKNNYQS
jgi:putative FmdB family regulatory protein